MTAAANHEASLGLSALLAEAVAHQQAGQADQADALYRQILESDPTHLPALSNLGVVWAAQGRITEAQEIYRRALTLAPRDADILTNLGNLQVAQDAMTEAEATYRQALEIEPRHCMANFGLGSLLAELDRTDEAIPHFEYAVDIQSNLSASDVFQMRAKLAALHLANGDSASAHQVVAGILSRSPDQADALCMLGDILAESDDPNGAEARYRHAAKVRPAWAKPLHRMGFLFHNQGRHSEATTAYSQAVEADPNDAAMLRDFGGHLIGIGLNNQGETALQASWNLNPRDVATAAGLADFLSSQGRDSEAIEFLQAADALRPGIPEIELGQALCLLRLGRHLDSLEILEAIVARDPKATAAQTLIGRTAFTLGRYSQALSALRAAVKLDPDDMALRVSVAHAERDAGSTLAAVDHVDHVLAREPRNKTAQLLKAQALSDLSRHDEAMDMVIDVMNHASSGDVDTLLVLAEVCGHAQRREEALRAYELVLKHRPGDPYVLARLVELKLTLCDWSGYQNFIGELVADVDQRIAAEDILPIDVHDLQNLPVSYAFLAGAARCKAAGIAREAEPARARCNFIFDDRLAEWRTGSGRRKIRLGYALPYTWFHSFPALMKEIIERHDRDQFEVFGYSMMPSKCREFEVQYRGQFDKFRDLPLGSPETAARIIHQDEVDIFVDVAGHSSINSQAVAALRPAPVAAHVLGYAMTSGAEYIDYLITDPVYMPTEFAAMGTEAVVYMPETHIAAADPEISDAKVTREEFGLPEEGFVFCNFNQPFKFGPTMFGYWMSMLRRVPGSVLWLGNWDASTRTNLRRETEAHGVDTDRLVFSNVIEQDKHLGRLRLADLALDTYPHGGGATTLEALWVGVPVLTYAGDTPASLAGDSILQTLGMPELITRTLEEYEEAAVALALNPERLAHVCGRLASNVKSSPVFDRDRYVRHLDRCFALIWEQTVAGERGTIFVPALDSDGR